MERLQRISHHDNDCCLRLRHALLEIGRLKVQLDNPSKVARITDSPPSDSQPTTQETPSRPLETPQVRALKYELHGVRRESGAALEALREESASLRKALQREREEGKGVRSRASTLTAGVGKCVHAGREILSGLESALASAGMAHAPGVPRLLAGLTACLKDMEDCLGASRRSTTSGSKGGGSGGLDDDDSEVNGGGGGGGVDKRGVGRARDLFADTLRGAAADASRENAHLRAQVASLLTRLTATEVALTEASGHEALALELKAGLDAQRGNVAALEAQLSGERARGSALRAMLDGLGAQLTVVSSARAAATMRVGSGGNGDTFSSSSTAAAAAAAGAAATSRAAREKYHQPFQPVSPSPQLKPHHQNAFATSSPAATAAAAAAASARRNSHRRRTSALSDILHSSPSSNSSSNSPSPPPHLPPSSSSPTGAPKRTTHSANTSASAPRAGGAAVNTKGRMGSSSSSSSRGSSSKSPTTTAYRRPQSVLLTASSPTTLVSLSSSEEEERRGEEGGVEATEEEEDSDGLQRRSISPALSMHSIFKESLSQLNQRAKGELSQRSGSAPFLPIASRAPPPPTSPPPLPSLRVKPAVAAAPPSPPSSTQPPAVVQNKQQPPQPPPRRPQSSPAGGGGGTAGAAATGESRSEKEREIAKLRHLDAEVRGVLEKIEKAESAVHLARSVLHINPPTAAPPAAATAPTPTPAPALAPAVVPPEHRNVATPTRNHHREPHSTAILLEGGGESSFSGTATYHYPHPDPLPSPSAAVANAIHRRELARSVGSATEATAPMHTSIAPLYTYKAPSNGGWGGGGGGSGGAMSPPPHPNLNANLASSWRATALMGGSSGSSSSSSLKSGGAGGGAVRGSKGGHSTITSASTTASSSSSSISSPTLASTYLRDSALGLGLGGGSQHQHQQHQQRGVVAVGGFSSPSSRGPGRNPPLTSSSFVSVHHRPSSAAHSGSASLNTTSTSSSSSVATAASPVSEMVREAIRRSAVEATNKFMASAPQRRVGGGSGPVSPPFKK